VLEKIVSTASGMMCLFYLEMTPLNGHLR